mmetsp:Transcript_17375/g.27752  ORF Transcript_17375/g.27752 Transcript_17375/m.27752 type:complete len:296 (+) Transcript_17375:44-931(+)
MSSERWQEKLMNCTPEEARRTLTPPRLTPCSRKWPPKLAVLALLFKYSSTKCSGLATKRKRSPKGNTGSQGSGATRKSSPPRFTTRSQCCRAPSTSAMCSTTCAASSKSKVSSSTFINLEASSTMSGSWPSAPPRQADFMPSLSAIWSTYRMCTCLGISTGRLQAPISTPVRASAGCFCRRSATHSVRSWGLRTDAWDALQFGSMPHCLPGNGWFHFDSHADLAVAAGSCWPRPACTCSSPRPAASSSLLFAPAERPGAGEDRARKAPGEMWTSTRNKDAISTMPSKLQITTLLE